MESLAGLEKMNNRISGIDFSRGVAILAVTLGHILGNYNLGNLALSRLVYSFELPLFFITSGMVYELMNKHYSSMYTYLKKQTLSILYPYMTFSIMLIILYSSWEINSGLDSAILKLKQSIILTISGLGVGSLWFLPTFFFSCVLSYYIYEKYCRDNLSILLCITIAFAVVGAILSHITEVTGSKEYMFLKGSDYIGMILWNTLSQVSRSAVGVALVLVGRLLIRLSFTRRLLISIGGVNGFSVYWILLVGFGIGVMNYAFVDLHFSFIRNPFIFYTSAIIASIGLVLFGNNIKTNSMIEWFGKNSLVLMFCQIVQGFLCRAFNRFFSVKALPDVYERHFFAFLTLLISILLFVVILKLVDKNRCMKRLVVPRRKQ